MTRKRSGAIMRSTIGLFLSLISIHARAEESDSKRVLVSFDGIGPVDRRYEASTEIALTANDSLLVSGFILQSNLVANHELVALDDPTKQSTSTNAYGFELQYRRYLVLANLGSFATRSSTGLFVEGGLVFQHFTTTTQTLSPTCKEPGENADSLACPLAPSGAATTQDFWSTGASTDVGFQITTKAGFVVNASAGMIARAPMSTIDESQYPWSWEAANGSGVHARFRLQLGWGF